MSGALPYILPPRDWRAFRQSRGDLEAVRELMRDGRERTQSEISDRLGAPRIHPRSLAPLLREAGCEVVARVWIEAEGLAPSSLVRVWRMPAP